MGIFKNKKCSCKKWLVYFLILSVAGIGLTGCGGGKEENNTQQSRALTDESTITLYQHESGETTEIALEEYLCGVVAGEMDVNWPQEALAAQAMVARTFTLEKIAAGGVEARGTDASTDITEFQAYNAEKVNDNVKNAVAETKDLVVCYQGKPIKAWFYSDGGGMTAATALEGLGYDKEETPYIQAVEDPGATLPDNPNQQWEAIFPMDQVVAAVAEVTGQSKEQISTVTIAETGPSGRAMKLQMDDLTVSAPALRLALGGEEMKSAFITEISIADQQLVVRGKGYGHGVGMSQWGALAMAEQGKTAEEIIHYFFKDVDIISVEEIKQSL